VGKGVFWEQYIPPDGHKNYKIGAEENRLLSVKKKPEKKPQIKKKKKRRTQIRASEKKREKMTLSVHFHTPNWPGSGRERPI